jgi:hypothetical protein
VAELRIHPRGYWLSPDPNHHCFDESIAFGVASLLNPGQTLVDLGCGDGKYVSYFRERGIFACGVDGNPHTPELSSGVCSVWDITQPLLAMQASWVICLEVGEHIPPLLEHHVFENISRVGTQGAVVSWAVPGQGGHGHVNCQPNQYVLQQMAGWRFEFDDAASADLRQAAKLPWFRDTLMVFRRDANQAATEAPPA